ncbi:MAG: glycine--tRNA ligase [Kiritimatiellia bacterium]
MEKKESPKSSLDALVSLCKRRGFIFQSSELYGGFAGFWDYGPLGCELKRNIKDSWWKHTVRGREDVEGLDASIIMHPAIWKASGHLDTFSDPMSMCKGNCRKLMRADQIWDIFNDSAVAAVLTEMVGDAGKIATWCKGKGKAIVPSLYTVQHPEYLEKIFETLKTISDIQALFILLATPEGEPDVLPCPNCGGVMTEPRPFNLMFKTIVGPVDDPSNVAYLRPETAQAIFADFSNVLSSTRQMPPFGIGQIGKSFRNEVTPRNYIFRSREFEQMELEFFIKPDEAIELLCGHVAPLTPDSDLSNPQADWGWECWHKYWVEQRKQWLIANGLPATSFVEYWQKPDELAHYARACVDIEYNFPFGTQELEGIAARGNFDLSRHQEHSGKNMEVFDEPLKLAVKNLSEEAKATFRAKTVADWETRHKTAEEANLFLDHLFDGKYIPHVIEPSSGVDRMALAMLCNAYEEQSLTDEKGKEDMRTVLHLKPAIAPVKVAVFPLIKNRPELYDKAREIFKNLQRKCNCFWDESGAIGRRYRRQDEIGTPWCVTVDFDTIEKDGLITLRDRDTMQQERISVEELNRRLDAVLLA